MMSRFSLCQFVFLFSVEQGLCSWGQWFSWYGCTKSCGGGGMRTRIRYCNDGSPSNGGSYCFDGTNFVSQQYGYDYTCADQDCPVNGNWGIWQHWSDCTKSCGGNGNRNRRRYCDDPTPSNGGQMCNEVITGTNFQYDYDNTCGNLDCPVDGNWTSWSEWSTCSTSCGGGNKTRERNCTNPPPQFGGDSCMGWDFEDVICSTHLCPVAALITGEDSHGATIGGTIGATVVVVIIVVIVVTLVKKRRRIVLEHKATICATTRSQHLQENVIFKSEPTKHDNAYLNIGRASGLSCTDTDVDNLHETNDATEVNSENVYCNVVLEDSPVLTNIRVDKLGDYIKKREMKDGLNDEYKKLPYDIQYPTTVATTKENIQKNRFKMIFPYDHTRVILQDGPDYINANYIDGFEKEKCYIACQGPTKATLVDHWRMIWQLNINRIVMLTNLVEGAKRKCERYWPEEEETVSTYGNLILTLSSVKTRATYVTRQISAENKTTREKRTIIQYHFTSWPDHGTPDPLYLVLFHRHVISEQSASITGPLLVHCSAGIGRTGTYIGLDSLYEQGKITEFIDVCAIVKKMRYCRMNMVQTPEQYVCLHRALHEAFLLKDRTINKKDFGMVWKEIASDQRPINHQILREEFKLLEEKKLEHPQTEYVFATSPENKDKNRNPSVVPADNNRVYLSSFEKGRTDYINAVRLPSYTTLIGYVTTQLPLPDTKVDFWTMVRDQNSSIIVLFLTDHSEADLVYSTSTGSLGLNTLKLSSTVVDEKGVKVVSLTLNKKDTKPKEIMIYQVVCDGLPEAAVLCNLANLISTRISMTEGPVTVVSCDGATICGLFCTFSNAVSSMTIDENADIFQLARLLQLRRPEFFQNFEEYQKVYEAMNFYLESTNVYANF